MRRAILLAVCLFAAAPALSDSESDDGVQVWTSAGSDRFMRFELGEVGAVVPFGIAGRVLTFEYLAANLRVGASVGEVLGGLPEGGYAAIAPLHIGWTFASQYRLSGHLATLVKDACVEVAAGINTRTWPFSPAYRLSGRASFEFYCFGLALEAGGVMQRQGTSSAVSPYAALLVHLASFQSRL